MAFAHSVDRRQRRGLPGSTASHPAMPPVAMPVVLRRGTSHPRPRSARRPMEKPRFGRTASCSHLRARQDEEPGGRKPEEPWSHGSRRFSIRRGVQPWILERRRLSPTGRADHAGSNPHSRRSRSGLPGGKRRQSSGRPGAVPRAPSPSARPGRPGCFQPAEAGQARVGTKPSPGVKHPARGAEAGGALEPWLPKIFHPARRAAMDPRATEAFAHRARRPCGKQPAFPSLALRAS